MTITRLLIVLAVTSLGFASAQDQPGPSENFSLGTRKFDFSKLQREQPPTTYNFSLHNSGQRVPILNPDLASTCYTMRTYVVNNDLDKKFVIKTGPEEVAYAPRGQDQQRSPLVENYTTCQPSSQFAVKTTVQPVESGPNSK
ncbi:MAG TPA: hypothetical protein VLK33_09915 [Terriglobales bacterium]|nr:hypothetical protein [Terriglobales bacterium]